MLLGSIVEGIQDVSTVEMLKSTLLGDLIELQCLQELWTPTHPTCIAKRREIGQHCYVAEEVLSPSDLLLLKRQLQVSEDQWRNYKVQLIAWRSPGE